MAQSSNDTRLAGRLKAEIDRAERPHKRRCDRYRRLDDVYAGNMVATDDKWRHDLHPPIALQLVETVVSAITEEPSEPVVKPLTPKDKATAEKWELLLSQQQDRDHYAEKEPRFVRSGLVRGLAVAKVAWDQRWAEVLKRNFDAQPGNVMVEQEPQWVRELVFDQPTYIPVDVCDFWWNPDARSPEEIDTAYYRTWETRANLEAMEKEGVYENIAEIPKDRNQGNTQTEYDANYGTNAPSDEVVKGGPIEIIERWTRDRLIVIADRKVVIRNEKNPFGHGLIPFVYASPIPRNGHVVGYGLCELIADEQAQYWIMGNQRLDNTEIMANSTLWIPNATDEIMDATGDAFPGRRVPIDNVALMPQWDRPNTSILEPSVMAEDRLLQQMKDQTGAVDYVSGAGQGSVDQQTATEVTLMQSGAQRRLMSFKQQFANARNRAGQQMIELNKRLMTKPELLVSMSGGSYEHDSVEPYELANSNCVYQVSDVLESTNQQQRRMEATIKLQTLMSVAVLPEMAGKVNLEEAVEDFSEAYGDDRRAFLNDMPMMPGAGLAPAMPGLGQPTPTTPPPFGGAGGSAVPTLPPQPNGAAA